MRVSVLGGLSVTVDGTSRVAAIPRRLAAIIGVLTLHEGRGVSRDRLLHLLWSDADPERARHALAQSIYSLRRLLGVDEVIVGTAQLTLSQEWAKSDLADLESAIASSDETRAIRCYRGPLLDGFSLSGAPQLERWIDEQRALLAQRFAGFLDTRGRVLRSEGRHGEAAVVLRRRAALDPLDATAALALMRAWADAGDTPAAVQHARVYGELVRQELDLDPDPQVEQLARALQVEARQPRDVVPRDATAPATLAATGSPFVAWRWHRDVANRWRVLAHSGTLVRWWARRSRHWKATVRRAASVSAGLAMVLLAFAQFGRVRREAQGPPSHTAVLPFRATALSGDLAFLPMGMVELLSVAWTERDSAVVVDVERIRQWWEGRAGEGAFPPSDSLFHVAGTLGASRFVTGTLVGNATQLIVRATLFDAGSRQAIASATVHGGIDSLPLLVNQLATRLVAAAAGAAESVDLSPNVDPRALRAYLRGRAAYQRADFRDAAGAFATALAYDSSLASAAVELALSSDWLEEAVPRAAALEAAASLYHRLPNVARQQLLALRGPRSPEPTQTEEHFAAWEQVARIGNRPELWTDLGRRLLADGRLGGLADADVRARAAFERALQLDSSNVGARLALASLLMVTQEAETAGAGSTRADANESIWVTWRRATRQHDTTMLSRVREGFVTASDDVLRRIGQSALTEGSYLEDGARALRLRETRALSTSARFDAVLAEHAYALNGGSPSRAYAATQRLADLSVSGAHVRLQVLDALYGGGDSAVALAAVDRLSEQLRRAVTPVTNRATSLADLCVLEQWRVWHRDFSNVETTRRALITAPAVAGSEPLASGSVACGYLIEAIARTLQGVPGARESLARAERLAMSGLSAGDLRQYATLALSRARAHRGEWERAYLLVQRRSVARGWPRYLASYLRAEATLAERLADTVAAGAALRHYIALRPRPDSSGTAEVEAAKRELRRLQGHS